MSESIYSVPNPIGQLTRASTDQYGVVRYTLTYTLDLAPSVTTLGVVVRDVAHGKRFEVLHNEDPRPRRGADPRTRPGAICARREVAPGVHATVLIWE
jgi:hypothetical protein